VDTGMQQALFIGDEVTAAAYRLAGLAVRTPPLEEAAAELRAAMSEMPPLLLVTTEYAARLPREELIDMLAQPEPPTLTVTDAAGRGPELDLAAWIRSGIVG